MRSKEHIKAELEMVSVSIKKLRKMLDGLYERRQELRLELKEAVQKQKGDNNYEDT